MGMGNRRGGGREEVVMWKGEWKGREGK